MKKLNLIVILVGLATASLKLNAKTVINNQKINMIDSVKKVIVDPVCKMKIKANASKTTIYNKVTYSFCSESCKQKFVAEPAKYVKNKSGD
ncbi:YHS domain-containing protein [Flavobacterium sp. W4I14]|nr:YHS domain-containing protein [Flavobacterium sp. W4I14]